MLKAELRKIYLAKRKNLSPPERNRKSRQIADCFFRNFDLNEVRFLHVFLPIERFKEVDTSLIFENVRRWFPRIELVAPRVNQRTNEIENVIFKPNTELIQSSWQIDEPAGNDFVAAEQIDLVLVPLLCFDRAGHRVGYGKGFYDRFLQNCRADCLKIGLSYFAPVEKISDTHESDVRLGFCVTPEKVFAVEPPSRRGR